MKTSCLTGLLILLMVSTATAQEDLVWVRTWEEAQRERPARLSSQGRIARATEPGTPLVIHGRVFGSDGTTPAAGVVVFAYHTDVKGHYDRPGSQGWRLKGWAISDHDGRFELATIRPAPRGLARGPRPSRSLSESIRVRFSPAPRFPADNARATAASEHGPAA